MKGMFLEISVNVLFAAYLLVLAVADIRKKELQLTYIAAGLLFIPLFMIAGPADIVTAVYGIIPGIIMLVLYFLSKGQIGMGDVLLLLVIGPSVGFDGCICIVFSALLLMLPVAAVILISGRLTRKSRVPFVPFIFVGNVVRLLMAAV